METVVILDENGIKIVLADEDLTMLDNVYVNSVPYEEYEDGEKYTHANNTQENQDKLLAKLYNESGYVKYPEINCSEAVDAILRGAKMIQVGFL